jgi:hypothetical protein
VGLPLVPGVIEVGLHWQVGEDVNAVSRLHFSATPTPFVTADLNTMATAVRTAFATNLAARMSGFNKLDHVTCLDLGSAAGTQGLDGTAVSGTEAGSCPVASMCVLINHKIARRYRGGKPRTYLPFGLGGDLTDPQTWSSTYVTNVQTGWTAFLAAINGHAFGALTTNGHVAVSYYQPGGQWNIVNNRPKYTPHIRTTAVVDPILNSVVNSRPANQRRRLQRG